MYDGSAHVSQDLLSENRVYISNTDRLKVLFSSTEHFTPKGFVASFHLGRTYLICAVDRIYKMSHYNAFGVILVQSKMELLLQLRCQNSQVGSY